MFIVDGGNQDPDLTHRCADRPDATVRRRPGDQWVWVGLPSLKDSEELAVMRYKWRQDRPNEKPTASPRGDTSRLG